MEKYSIHGVEKGELVVDNENMALVLDLMPVGIRIVDVDSGKLVYANRASMDIFGCEDFDRDVAGRSAFDFMPEIQPNGRKTMDMANEFFSAEKVCMDFECFKLHGERFFARITSSNIVYMGKLSSLAIIEDITEEKFTEMKREEYREHLEREVKQRTAELTLAREKAEDADRQKSTFLANMSHEIRTPLNGILGIIQFLDDDSLSSEQRSECINVIKAGGEQLSRIIEDIVDISKIESGLMTVQPVSVQLNELMNGMHDFLKSIIHTNSKEQVTPILDSSEFLADSAVFVDPVRLRQVIINLLGNAVKFTEKGFIRFGYRQIAPHTLEFFVEDTGIGIAASEHENIFKRFQQAESGNGRHYGGSGLGLTISHSLVQLMGGDIRVESTEGQGALFIFTISV